MRTPHNVLIVFLVLTTASAGGLAWQQYQRAQRSSASEQTDRDELLKKLHAAERRAADLEARLAALEAERANQAANAAPAAADATAPETARNNRRPGNRGADFAALMNNPEVMKLMSAQQKAALDGRYAALFKQLNLSPQQLEKFKDLLAEKRTSFRDVMMAAREQGLTPGENREELRALVEETNREIEASIRSTLGDDDYRAYQEYEATGNQRALVDQIGRSLSYTSTPLTPSQSQALVQIFGQNPASATADASISSFGPMRGGANTGGNIVITDAMVTQAAGVLSSSQLEAVKNQQAAQQAEQKLRTLMRSQAQAASARP